MNYEIVVGPAFRKRAKRIVRKYPLAGPVIEKYIQDIIVRGPRGNRISQYLWKDRIPLIPYKKGKSGGLRIIVFNDPLDDLLKDIIALVLIYPKSEMESPPKKLLTDAVRETLQLISEAKKDIVH